MKHKNTRSERGITFGMAVLRVIVPMVLLTSFAISVTAQKELPPPGGQPKPFIFPKQDTYSLPNGMKVTLVEYGAVPKVSIQAIVRAGSLNERMNERWISDMVASMLKEGTTTRTGEQIAREAAEMGGSLYVTAGTDKTIIGGEALSEFDTRAIELLADVLLKPRFAAADLEKLRASKLQELAVSRAQPGTIAWEKFRETVFPNHAYSSILPTEDTLKSYSLVNVKSFYYNQFGAERTHLYVVGQFDQAKVKAEVAKLFGSWKKGPEPIRNAPKINAFRSLEVIDRPDAPQSTIYLGMPAIGPADPDFVKLVVMDSLLGSSFGSRITSNIREQKGYTYSPGSFIWSRHNAAYWIESADVTTESTGASIKEILFEIDRLRGEPPSETELQGIKNYLIGIYVLQNSTRDGVINELENVNYYELGSGYLNAYVQKLASVTPADVSEMANRYLVAEKMTIVVVGDKAKIEEQLKPYVD